MLKCRFSCCSKVAKIDQQVNKCPIYRLTKIIIIIFYFFFSLKINYLLYLFSLKKKAKSIVFRLFNVHLKITKYISFNDLFTHEEEKSTENECECSK